MHPPVSDSRAWRGMIRRKPMDPKYENAVSAVFMLFLLVLMAVIAFKDIIGLF